jgi:hypothetical protein
MAGGVTSHPQLTMGLKTPAHPSCGIGSVRGMIDPVFLNAEAAASGLGRRFAERHRALGRRSGWWFFGRPGFFGASRGWASRAKRFNQAISQPTAPTVGPSPMMQRLRESPFSPACGAAPCKINGRRPTPRPMDGSPVSASRFSGRRRQKYWLVFLSVRIGQCYTIFQVVLMYSYFYQSIKRVLG